MENSKRTMAQQIADAAGGFQQQRTGVMPGSVTVALSDQTLVITLHDTLSAAEKALARSPAGAAKIREFHQQLFATSAEPLRQEIRRITGVDVSEPATEDEPALGTFVQVFTSGTMVQVFLLAQNIPAERWNACPA